jgi:hypothetical protein
MVLVVEEQGGVLATVSMLGTVSKGSGISVWGEVIHRW